MVRRCLSCGRRLRTGIKWCYTCKGIRTTPEERIQNKIDKTIGTVGLMFLFLFIPILIYFKDGFQAYSWFILMQIGIVVYAILRTRTLKRELAKT